MVAHQRVNVRSSNNDCSERRYSGTEIIEEISSAAEPSKRYVVERSTFYAGMLISLAYLAVKMGKEYFYYESDEDHRTDRTKKLEQSRHRPPGKH